jgi:di/tricarboxylate transporter
MLIVAFIRLGFAEMLAITATVLPITLSLSEIWGINAIWLIQIMIISCSFSYFFPFQSTSNLITYSYGHYTEKDLLKTGFVFTPIFMLAVLAFAMLYWPMVGLSIIP